MNKQTCPCCGYKTLEERNNWETCPICKLNDDEVQAVFHDIRGAKQRNFKRRSSAFSVFSDI